jgi:hypothetical protein
LGTGIRLHDLTHHIVHFGHTVHIGHVHRLADGLDRRDEDRVRDHRVRDDRLRDDRRR